MDNLINSNFNKTYNPSGKQNVLSDIKRLLTSRNTEAQIKACGYLIDVLSRHGKNSKERFLTVEYLLDNDITVFLCEATSNLDFYLFRSILSCIRLLWSERRFFTKEHGSHAMSAVLRALSHYAGSSSHAAVDLCLQFLCDLLTWVSVHKTTPALSHQSGYSAEQLLACLNALAPSISTNSACITASALVLHALVSYQPENLALRGNLAAALAEILENWLRLLMGALNHATLVGDSDVSGMCYVIVCQLGNDVLRLTKCLNREKQNVDFVQSILHDEHETNLLKDSAQEMKKCIAQIHTELVVFTKDNLTQIATKEYSVFLKFLLNFFYESVGHDSLADLCDMLFSKNYLTMLPHAQIDRNDSTVRKVSTLVLGEMLKVLSSKYLNVVESGFGEDTYVRDIQMGLVELQRGVEEPQGIGAQLRTGQPYCLLVYVYFYCQSSDNPEEATAALLPYLVEHILRLSAQFKPPPYIIKALWLVFAMSTISNGSLKSLEERVYLEKATDRLVSMLQPEPAIYYTHNPAVLLWAFTSQRIPNYVRIHVLSQWLQIEDSIPSELTTISEVWELLLTILVHNKNRTIVANCTQALHFCLQENPEEERRQFAATVWVMLPNALSKTLIDYKCKIDPSICHLLELATTAVPDDIDQALCLKAAVLVAIIFSKELEHSDDNLESKFSYEHACLKLGLHLLALASSNNDNRVLLTYINREGFLPRVMVSALGADENVACAALQLLCYIVQDFTKNNYQPNSILQIQTQSIIITLKEDSSSERGSFLLQLVYNILNSGPCTPLVLALELDGTPPAEQQCNALRALMFRIQLMLCCRNSESQCVVGWKTLSSIFKFAIVAKNDPLLVATLTSQPWTHILIQFTLTQKPTEEFLTFTQNWLTLLSITLRMNQTVKRRDLSKKSLILKTLLLLKKNLSGEGELAEAKQKTLVIVKEILVESEIFY